VSAPPLLIVGHGTRSAAGVAGFAQFVARTAARAGGLIPAVDGGFIELARPSVADAVARLAPPGALPARGSDPPEPPGASMAPERQAVRPHRAGPREIVAVPLVLTAAGHGKGDIPAVLARELGRHPGLSFRYGRPLGPHPVLQDMLEARIDAALAGDSRRDTHVVLAGRGATDPDANAEVAKVARLLWEGRGYAAVEYSFISLAEPSVPAALDRARRLGARRIVVAPYFLFSGVLPDRVAAQSREFAAGDGALDVRVAGLLGDCDDLAGLVLERYDEALRGDIRMNCDTCAYRVALPGFTDKVGRPQIPHYHPGEAMDPTAVSHRAVDHHVADHHAAVNQPVEHREHDSHEVLS
jgi:sirohydrochlorin cobaltochelatase